MAVLKKVYDLLYVVIKYLLILITGIMCVTVFFNVITRYLFGGGIMLADELSRFIFIYISILGSVVCVRSNEHMHLSLLIELLPKKIGISLDIISHLIVISLCGVLFVGGLSYALNNLNVYSAVMHIPFGYIYIIIPIGGALMGIQYLIHMITIIGGLFSKTDKSLHVAAVSQGGDEA